MLDSAAIAITYLTTATGFVWTGVVIWLLIGLFRLKPYGGNNHPVVSVLIAARNEAGVIGKCLQALVKQDYPPELWDVIVVNDNSTDSTGSEVRSFSEEIHKLKLLSIDTPPRGKAPKKHALYQGIKTARGEIILTTDADCLPQPGWISSMANQFEAGIDAVAGYSPLSGKGIAGKVGSFDALVNGIVSAGAIGQGQPVTVAGRNFGFRRSVWLEIGGYGENIKGASGDDDLLLQRISNQGGKVRFNAEASAQVLSSAPPSLSAWWRTKRRHISAGKRYNPVLTAFSAMLYTFQVGLVLSLILTISGWANPWYLLSIWGVKVVIDGFTVMKGAALFNATRWAIPLIVAELISPLLFTALIPAAMMGKIRWKGRDLEG